MEPEPVSVTAPPLPRPHLLRQQWLDLTFLHWAVEPASVERYYPPGTRPDTFEGKTYVGLIPFRMLGTGFAHGPAMPWLGSFLETNVRLYSVDRTGRRGVIFLSLDANRVPVVAAARAIFGLPYRWTRLRYAAIGDIHTYVAERGPSRIQIRAGEPLTAGPLEHWLTARWGLHVAHLGKTWYLPNEHPAWTLRSAELLDLDDGLLATHGLGHLTTRPPDHLAFSHGVPVSFGHPVLLE
ncbi:DUF2071 domain-containing protein [Kribbella sp. NBC_01245]|uniref:YqjF family protein n=1 Tax=Kribbella sp. NBC_01245 TaxID=2903578 RepID=UPI002E2A1CF7|nr:DUF2071 domain-containing protein [Kribbella sp. NBC_01245]